jgi:hypothetical protein
VAGDYSQRIEALITNQGIVMKCITRFLFVFVLSVCFLSLAAIAQPIYLNTGVIDTSRAPQRAALPGAAGDQLHLVQFDGPIQPEWVAQLEAAGWRIVDFVPDNTYIVYGGSNARKALKSAVSHVSWQGALLPGDKIQPRATAAALQQRKLTKPDSKLFAMQLIEEASANAVTIALLEEMTGEPVTSIATNEMLRFVNIRAALPEDRIEELAARPDVLTINTYEPPKRKGERQGQIVAGNLNAAGSQPTGPGYLAWLTGKGFTQAQFDASGMVIDIADDGWDRGVAATPANREFRVEGDAAKASRVKYSQTASKLTEANSAGTDGHGNINISIVGGYNNLSGAPYTDTAGYHRGLGINPFALMGNTKVFDDEGYWDATSAQEAKFIATNYHKGVRISSDSWGSDGDGSYDSDAQSYDSWTRDSQPLVSGNQEVLYVFAAGNDGPSTKSIGPPGTGKNIISAGASENYNLFGTDGCGTSNSDADNANDIVDFSSRGPCLDRRIKPDLVAPGSHVAGAASFAIGYTGYGVCDKYQPAGQTNYAASSGTSHSTPAIAGGASLVYQYFINQSWGTPSPAMMKAYLMNSARYMTGVDAGDTLPSNNQGMGLMNLGTAFDGVTRMLRDQLTGDIFTASGQSRTYFAMVSDSSKPLRITLGWTDAPGSTSGNAYKNNLDLSVTVGGKTYLGNVFFGAHSETGGSADVRNNMESVFLPAGESGLVTIKVTAFNINSDGVPNYGTSLDQDFVLVAYNAEEYTPSDYPPEIEPIGNKAMATNRLMQFTVTASDPVDGDTVRLWATGIPAWATFPGATNAGTASAQFSGTTPETTGSYNVVFYAADKDGTTSESIVIEVNDINCIPAVVLQEDFDDSTSVPAGWVNGGSANDSDSTHYKSAPNCRAMGIGATLETPPMNTPTQIVFYVDASSKGNGKTATLDYKVGDGEWTKVGNFMATTAGATETFNLTSSPDLSEQANVSFRFSSSFSTWYLDDVVITGFDCGTGFLPNNPPSIGVSGGTNQSVSVGSELSFSVTANDADGDDLSLQSTSLPGGALFDATNGPAPLESTFTWTPVATGKYSAVFTASDGKAVATQAVSITVGPYVAPLLPPEIQAATHVMAEQFNANWLVVSNATGYRLDVSENSSFSGGSGGSILTEDFSGLTVSGGGTDISGSLDTYLQTPGWTGSKIYEDAGRAKLGASTGQGILTTPTLNLSGNGGVATLTFDLLKYGTDSTTVQVLHAPDGENFSQVGDDITAPEAVTLQSVEITGGTAASKLRIQGKGFSKQRFYVDNLLVEGGSGTDSYVAGYQNRDVGNVTTCAVTGLTENVTYYYRVRSYHATSNSVDSATTNVTTMAMVDVPPVLNPIGNKTVALGGNLQFAVTAMPTDDDEVTLSTSALPAGATFGATNETGTFEWNNAGPVGVYPVTFYAEDEDGQDSETITITVYDPEAELQAPVIQAASGVQAQQFNANWLASAGALGYRLDVATDDSFTPGGGGGGGGIVLSEDFSGFTTVSGGVDRASSLNTYLQTPGWTGSRVYEDGGRAKLGATSGLGYIVTPTVDLSGGDATLTFDVAQYATDGGSIEILHAADGSTFTPLGSDLTLPATMTAQSIPITGGTANSKIKFSAKAASKNRFYLDNVAITAGSGGGSGSFVAGYEDRDVGNVTTFAVTGLTENITYYYRVLAYDATDDSDYSATTNVTTVAPPPLAAPVIQAASGVQAQQFNANWLASDGALGYQLDVSTNETFSGGGSESTRELLATNAASSASIQTDGWSATDTGGTTYVQMLKPTATILSPAFSTVGFTNLTVDMMARTFGGVNAAHNLITVSISSNNGTAWDTLGTALPTSSSMANMATLTDETHVGHAETRLRWQSLGGNGNIGAGVQQLHIRGWTSGSAGSDFVAGYENRDVGNVTTFAVTGLTENVTYYYRVRAYDAGGASANSAVTNVTTTASAPAEPPTFADFIYAPGSAAEASFQSQVGVLYQLEYTTDLSADPADWIPIDIEEGTGGILILEDDDPSDPARYYRIVID